MNKYIHYLKFALGWPLSLLALFFVTRLIFGKTHGLALDLSTINYYFLITGMAFFAFYFLFRTILWRELLKSETKKHIAFFDAFYFWMMSEIRRFIPGNIWSVVGRTTLFGNLGFDKKQIWRAMAKEIQYFILGGCIISLFSLPFLFDTLLWNISYKHELYEFLVLLPFILIFVIMFHTKLTRLIIPNFLFLANTSPIRIFLHFLLILSSLVFYGLGTYFSILSIGYLNPNLILNFVGFFVLSLLIGYLSFITPMGLGVREGVVTSGLAYVFPLQLAALSAIFARIVLVITELIVLSLSYVWHQTRKHWFSQNKHILLVLLGVSIYSLYFSMASFLRYDHLLAGRFDLGNMDQTVWNTLHGHMFQFTDPNGTQTMLRLGFHADFILTLLAPFYLIWSDPRMLLLIQSVGLAMGALFVYLFANLIVKNKTASVLISFCYLLNPAIQYSNLYDFHSVALATPLLLGSWYFLQKNKLALFTLFLLLACLTKEQVWLVGALFGIYIFFGKNQKTLGSILFSVSIFMFYYLVWYAIPSARGSAHFALTYYSDFGDSPTQIIKNILLEPTKTIGTLINFERIRYVYQLFMPVGFISFLSPFILLFVVPDFAINLLSNNTQLHSIYYQYSAVITPFIFISAVYSLEKIVRKYSSSVLTVSIALVCFTMLSVYFDGPLPGAKSPSITMFASQKSAVHAEIAKYLSNIPKDKKVSATNNLGAHVSQRQFIYTIPQGIDDADIVVFYLDDPYILPSPKDLRVIIEQLKEDSRFKLVYQKNLFFVFEKK